MRRGIKPSDILTPRGIRERHHRGRSPSAVRPMRCCTCWPSRTRRACPLTLDDFTRIGARVPVLADLRPSGKYSMSELIAIGGMQPLMKMLLDAGLLHGDCLTVTGKTLAENLADVRPYPGGAGHRSALRQSDQEGQPSGHALRQPGARRRGGQDHRQGRPAIHRHGARVRVGRGQRCRRSSTARWWRAMSSSFATRVPGADPACARCSARPARSWARVWATRSR